MVGVVAAAVVEVDAAEKRHVILRTVGVADDDHLLVVAAEREHPLVQQHLTTRPVDRGASVRFGPTCEPTDPGVGVPQQPPYPSLPAGRPG